MSIIGPILFLIGFLALAAGALHFLPIARLRARRRFAKQLLIGGAVALIASLIITPTPPKDPTTRSAQPEALASGPAAKAMPAPTPAPTISTDPRVVIDDSLLPVLNVDLIFAAPFSPDSFPRIGAVVGEVGKRMNADGGARGNASAINFMVRGADNAPAMHFTVMGDDLRKAAKAGRSDAYYLNLAREPGFNDIKVERIARQYCLGANTPFCVAT